MLVGGVRRSVGVRGRIHPLLGVAQDLLGRAAAVVVARLGFLGEGHGAARHTIFRNLGCHARGYPGRPIGNRVAPRSPDTGIHPCIGCRADGAGLRFAEEFSPAKQQPRPSKEGNTMITTEVRTPRATTIDTTPASPGRSAEPKERTGHARLGAGSAAARPTLALQRRLITGMVG